MLTAWHYRYQLSERSLHPGFIFWMRSIFFARLRSLISFSRRIAHSGDPPDSRYTSLWQLYREANEYGFIFCLCSRILLSILFVTPVYSTVLFLFVIIYTYIWENKLKMLTAWLFYWSNYIQTCIISNFYSMWRSSSTGKPWSSSIFRMNLPWSFPGMKWIWRCSILRFARVSRVQEK